MATKDEERKALAKIQKIVKDLGENSYIGTALDGALDLAEQNIDCDAAFSARYYQDTLYKTDDKLKAAEKKIAELENKLERQKAESDAEYEAVRRRLLDNSDVDVLKRIVAAETSERQQEVSNAAARIVEAADTPASAAFRNAVEDHRIAQQKLTRYTELLKRLCEISDDEEAEE